MSAQNKPALRRRDYSAGYSAGRRNTPYSFIRNRSADYLRGWSAGNAWLMDSTSPHPKLKTLSILGRKLTLGALITQCRGKRDREGIYHAAKHVMIVAQDFEAAMALRELEFQNKPVSRPRAT